MTEPEGVEVIAKALVPPLGRGWTRVDAGPHVDLGFRASDGRLLVVEVKHPRAGADVRGPAAMAVLHLRRFSPPDAIGVVALLVPVVSDRAAASVGAYLNDVAPGLGWVMCDDRGASRGEIPALSLTLAAEGAPRAPRTRPSSALFTDLNRWMLKFLLHRGCPPDWFGRPTQRVPDATRLAAATGVSVAKAYEFVQRGTEVGFVTRRPIRLREVERLLETWLQAEGLEAPVRVPVQWALGSTGDLRPLAAYRGRWAVGGLAACESLGLRHLQLQAPLVVHVDDVDEACRACDGVAVTHEQDAHVILLPARYPESVFRARVAQGKVWHVDAWQAALDTAALRGGEQAEFIRDRILAARHDD